MYPSEIVLPMKAELTDEGFNELITSDDVNSALEQKGTSLVFINSVCGCAAGSARPGVLMAVSNSAKRPDPLLTSFAGFDTDAVERHMIEGRPAQMIAQNLIGAFEQYCN
jgi:putative YphP/YqiW family bacilliredoxin